jgi:hypothetical protein
MKLYEFFSVASVKDHDPNLDQNRKSSKEEREKLANDVFWFILDHDDLHKQHFLPIAQEIYKESTKGNVDRKKYKECWMPMVEQGCMSFYKKQKMKGNPNKVFTEEFCEDICERLAEHHIEDIVKGSYKLGK